MERTEIVKDLYETMDEDKRQVRSRQGQLEYFITMHYIHKFLNKGVRVLEIGGGRQGGLLDVG